MSNDYEGLEKNINKMVKDAKKDTKNLFSKIDNMLVDVTEDIPGEDKKDFIDNK